MSNFSGCDGEMNGSVASDNLSNNAGKEYMEVEMMNPIQVNTCIAKLMQINENQLRANKISSYNMRMIKNAV